MKRLTVPAALVLVIALGSYTIFAEHVHVVNDGVAAGAMTGGMVGGGTTGGTMDNMNCSGCAMMPTAIAATNDGGVIVAAAGKLIKYDAIFKKVLEVDISSDIDPNTAPQKTP